MLPVPTYKPAAVLKTSVTTSLVTTDQLVSSVCLVAGYQGCPGIRTVKQSLLLYCLQMTSDQLFDIYKGFIEKYPVVSIEDAFDQDDWPAWTKMNEAVGIQLVG